jgi:hypothetical protein
MKRLLVAAMLVLAGCGTGPAAGQSAHEYRLVVEKLGGNGVSIVTTSAPTPVSLPGGFLTADGSQLFSLGGQVFDQASGSLGTTTLNAYDARSGALARQIQVTGAWSWLDGGTSPSGRWLVLTQAAHGSAAPASPRNFLVVDTTSSKQYPVGLKGNFSFDALSNDGQSLYLIETLVGSAYQVRLYHVFSRTLEPGAVVIKGPELEAMNGYKITAVAEPDGHMLYSLYGRSDGRPPFVHALDLDHQFAFCIDLPELAAQRLNYPDAASSGWALSLDANRHLLYASSSRGQVVAIDTNQFKAVHNAALAAPDSTGWLPSFMVDAAAKEFEGPPAASAVDPKGRWLYVAWESGYLAVDTATLRPAALRDRGDHLSSLEVSPDGRHLFAVGGTDLVPNVVSDLDPQTGARLATITGLAAPWRILRLEPAA